MVPETNPADLAEKIIRGKYTETKPAKKYSRRFIGAALCAALAVTTVTVGAAADWDFKGFFGNIFGGNTENMSEYIVDGGRVTIESETFDKFDFTVTGLAADENMVYLGLDIISLDGKALPDDTRLGIQCGYEGGFQSVSCIENKDGRLSCLITLFDDIWNARKGVITIFEIYSVNSVSDDIIIQDNGIFKIDFDIECTLPMVKIEAPFDLEIPSLFYETKISYNDTVTEGTMSYTVNSLSLSGMSMVLDYEKPHNNEVQGFYDNDKIYLLLDDGSKAAVKSVGTHGSSSSEDGVNFTSETGKIMFIILEPVDVNNVSAVVFGDTVVHF